MRIQLDKSVYNSLKKLLDYFLKNIEFENEFARMKVRFLFGFLLFAFCVNVIYTINHAFILGRGAMFVTGDFFTMVGIFTALFLLTKNKLFEAGIILITGVSITIFVGNVLGDYLRHGTPISYARIYISGGELMLLGLVSVLFITKKEVFLVFGVVAMFIMIFHFVAIQANPMSFAVDKLTPYSYLFGMMTMIVIMSGIGYFILYYLERIERSNSNSRRKIKLQNEFLEATVEARTKALKESNQSLHEFAYVISHDLKEPLRSVGGFVSIAQRSLNEEQGRKEDIDVFLKQASKGVAQMEVLIKDILEYSKLTNVLPEMKPISLNNVFETVQERLAKSIEESSATIKCNSLPDVLGEKTLITQLFQNLISNAVKYRSAERQPIIEIGFVAFENGGGEIYVKDNGIGISPNNLSSIFEPFKRLHGSESKYEGVGIGLAICNKIATIHGGSIRVESEEGKGSVFYISLPVVI